MNSSIIYVTKNETYVVSGNRTREVGRGWVSPVVGSIPGDVSTNDDLADKIHYRAEGYKKLYSREIQVGDRLIRDDPKRRPYAAITSRVTEIIVVMGGLEKALKIALDLSKKELGK